MVLALGIAVAIIGLVRGAFVIGALSEDTVPAGWDSLWRGAVGAELFRIGADTPAVGITSLLSDRGTREESRVGGEDPVHQAPGWSICWDVDRARFEGASALLPSLF